MEISDKHIQSVRQSLNSLAEGISNLVIREQQTMNQDFIRMADILREAARNLRDCFEAMSTELSRQSAQLRMHTNNRGGHSETDPDVDTLMSTTTEISIHVGKAIRSLQFEDILQQMIAHTRRRGEEIEQLFITLNNHINDLDKKKEENSEEIMQALQRCLKEIEAVNQALGLNNPVRNKNLDQGDIELF